MTGFRGDEVLIRFEVSSCDYGFIVWIIERSSDSSKEERGNECVGVI